MNNELFTTKEICQLFVYITPKVLEGLLKTSTISRFTVAHAKPAKFDYSNTVYIGYINALHSILKGKAVKHLAQNYTLEDWQKSPCRVLLFNHAIRYKFNDELKFLSEYGDDCKELTAFDSENNYIYYLDSPEIFKRLTDSDYEINTALFKPYYCVLLYKIEEKLQNYITKRNSQTILTPTMAAVG